jgi:hypothetical protein
MLSFYQDRLGTNTGKDPTTMLKLMINARTVCLFIYAGGGGGHSETVEDVGRFMQVSQMEGGVGGLPEVRTLFLYKHINDATSYHDIRSVLVQTRNI